MRHAIELDSISLSPKRGDQPIGAEILDSLLNAAERALESLLAHSDGPCAALGRVRGNGRDVSFSGLVSQLEADHPIELRFPFDGSEHVGGAI